MTRTAQEKGGGGDHGEPRFPAFPVRPPPDLLDAVLAVGGFWFDVVADAGEARNVSMYGHGREYGHGHGYGREHAYGHGHGCEYGHGYRPGYEHDMPMTMHMGM